MAFRDNMNYFELQLDKLGLKPIPTPSYLPPMGKTYAYDGKDGMLHYWIYMGDGFLFNIHDFYIKEDRIFEFESDESLGTYISISVIKEASGDLYMPKREINAGTILSYFHDQQSFRGLLHKNSRYISVGIEYQNGYLDQVFCKKYDMPFEDVKNACLRLNELHFFEPLNKITDEIFHYKSNDPSSPIFYEQCANNALLEILKDYYQKKVPLPKDDEMAVQMVSRHLDEHYMMDFSLDLLSEIATMSKSKLKVVFKNYYGMTITEYVQRRRIHVAEHLILTTDLDIAHIAKAVGYQSHSRFSQIFKRYLGLNPMEYKKNRK
ncbi:MAG: AraC family transcriptional regulator [Tissierellia bacterium]|nr:AraC family transcriptional regulator [Tissierellia bacterium]